jgi:hypothetical protein
MPPRSLLRGFLFLWLVTGIVLLIGSLETVRSAVGSSHHANPHLALLGSVEGLAAALFLVPRSMRVGAIGLLLTIFIAFAVHTALHEFRGDLLLYSATVLFVLIHGPLTREQFRVALTPTRTTAEP